MVVLCAVVGAAMYLMFLAYSAPRSYEGGEYSLELQPPIMEGPRGAVPATAPQSWVLSQDYPKIALDGGISGKTRFTVTVSPFGEVDECLITQKSGYPELDNRVCNAISTRAKFHPALDADDRPTEGRYSNTVVWALE